MNIISRFATVASAASSSTTSSARSSVATSAAVWAAVSAATLLVGCGKPADPVPTSAPTPAGVATPAGAALSALPDLKLPAVEAMPAIGTCSVENVVALPAGTSQAAVKNVYTASAGSTVKFIGFAAHKDKGEPLSRFTLMLAGAQVFTAPADTGLERPDVAQYFNKPGLLKSGFQVDVSLKGLPPGDYVFYLRQGDGPVCPTHQTLRVSG